MVHEVHKEYKEKRKNEQNVTYQKEKESMKKSSVVNPSQLQYHNNPQEDDEFLTRLFNIHKEFGTFFDLFCWWVIGLLSSQLQGATKLKEKYKAPLIAQAQNYAVTLIKGNRRYSTLEQC